MVNVCRLYAGIATKSDAFISLYVRSHSFGVRIFPQSGVCETGKTARMKGGKSVETDDVLAFEDNEDERGEDEEDEEDEEYEEDNDDDVGSIISVMS